MVAHEAEKLLVTLDNTDEYYTYKTIYEAASSALSELEDSYMNYCWDQTDTLLGIWSRLLRQICKRLNGDEYSSAYEAGKLCGIISTFESLYRKEQDVRIINAAMSELLSKSKPASRRILQILYESGKEKEWISNQELLEITSQQKTSLSNIMKRLVQAQAVDFYKDGRKICYRLTPAGKRYYEENISSSMSNPPDRMFNAINEKIDDIKTSILELSDRIKRQEDTIGDINRKLPENFDYNKRTMQNNAAKDNLEDYLAPQARRIKLMNSEKYYANDLSA